MRMVTAISHSKKLVDARASGKIDYVEVKGIHRKSYFCRDLFNQCVTNVRCCL